MTPAQQTALESLLGRALTLAETTAIDPLLDPNNRNDVAITAIVNDGMPSTSGSLSVEDVFDSLYVTGDYATLKAAQLANQPAAVMAFAALYDAKNIGKNQVNFALQTTTDLLDGIETAGSLSAAGRAALLARATVKATVYRVDEISRELNIAEGRMVL